MMELDQRGSEVLSVPECMHLLASRSGGIGRVGFVRSGEVQVIPTNYRLGEGAVVVQIGFGAMFDSLRHGESVAFEVDDADDKGTAWSVLVRGRARRLLDPGPGGDATDTLPAVREPGAARMAIALTTISGRRFHPRHRPGGPAPDSPRSRRPLTDITLRRPVSVPSEAPLRAVAATMAEANVTCALVAGGLPCIVTDHDLAAGLAAGLGPEAPVAQVANPHPVWATTSTTVGGAIQMMTRHGIRHLLVITTGGSPVGIVALLDLTRFALSD